MAKKRIGALLAEKGYITEFQLVAALSHQRKWKTKLGQSLIELGYLDEDQLYEALAEQLGLELVDLRRTEIPPDLLRLIDREFVKEWMAVPLSFDGQSYTVAVAEQDKPGLKEALESRLGGPVKIALATSRDIEAKARKVPEKNQLAVVKPVKRPFIRAENGEIRAVEDEPPPPVISLVETAEGKIPGQPLAPAPSAASAPTTPAATVKGADELPPLPPEGVPGLEDLFESAGAAASPIITPAAPSVAGEEVELELELPPEGEAEGETVESLEISLEAAHESAAQITVEREAEPGIELPAEAEPLELPSAGGEEPEETPAPAAEEPLSVPAVLDLEAPPLEFPEPPAEPLAVPASEEILPMSPGGEEASLEVPSLEIAEGATPPSTSPLEEEISPVPSPAESPAVEVPPFEVPPLAMPPEAPISGEDGKAETEEEIPASPATTEEAGKEIWAEPSPSYSSSPQELIPPPSSLPGEDDLWQAPPFEETQAAMGEQLSSLEIIEPHTEETSGAEKFEPLPVSALEELLAQEFTPAPGPPEEKKESKAAPPFDLPSFDLPPLQPPGSAASAEGEAGEETPTAEPPPLMPEALPGPVEELEIIEDEGLAGGEEIEREGEIEELPGPSVVEASFAEEGAGLLVESGKEELSPQEAGIEEKPAFEELSRGEPSAEQLLAEGEKGEPPLTAEVAGPAIFSPLEPPSPEPREPAREEGEAAASLADEDTNLIMARISLIEEQINNLTTTLESMKELLKEKTTKKKKK